MKSRTRIKKTPAMIVTIRGFENRFFSFGFLYSKKIKNPRNARQAIMSAIICQLSPTTILDAFYSCIMRFFRRCERYAAWFLFWIQMTSSIALFIS
jgi:hypothetical protein